MMNYRGLYVHIPFCNHICNYCDFCKMVSTNDTIHKYILRLLEEIDLYKEYYKSVKTIYIGGGTPNILSDNDLELLLKKIESLNIDYTEYTIEVNPELLTEYQVILFKKYGINRVSIGAESFNDLNLEYLGRHHKKKDIFNSINLLKKYEINNISIDLIFAYPNDSISNIKEELEIIKTLDIPHISLYSLILEERTLFYYKYNKNEFKPIDEDLAADMMELIESKLNEFGFNHYEISNYSKPGFESCHNLLYWSSLEYVGVGLGASGYLKGIRYDNTKVLSTYLNTFKKDEVKLSINDKKSEYFMLGLRKLEGVSLSNYKSIFNSDPFKDFNLEKLINLKLCEIKNDYFKLTHKGLMLGNIVFEEFV